MNKNIQNKSIIHDIHEKMFQKNDIAQIASQIINEYPDLQAITLKGTLGAGKTTLAIELLRQFGVTGETQSPTYTYLQAYKNSEGKNFYHFDLYRLKDKDAFLFAGFDEFLYQPNSLVIIEWPEIVEPLLEHNVCVVELGYRDEMTRIIQWYCK
jgi:tRNA threonylcarbamoyladenosine biosynthesis protein TsaE